ncbi:MAG: type II secretion system protein GspD [Cyanobacteriota bacterium]
MVKVEKAQTVPAGNGRFRRGAAALAVLPLAAQVVLPVAQAQEAFPAKVPDFPNQPGPVRVVSPAAMELKVRRVRDAVEVVIENTGAGPQLEQTTQGSSWLGRLYTAKPSALLRGPQQLALPEAGFQSISIEGGGTIYNLRVTPVAGYPVMRPLVSADGRQVVLSFPAQLQPSLQTMQRNSLAPGAVANPNFAPPLRQRATAPPVGDMAVGTMLLKDPSYLNVSGPRVTLTFKSVPASTALQALARVGRYGFVYNISSSDSGGQQSAGTTPSVFQGKTKEGRNANPPVTATFVAEDYRTAINMVLASTGLQARLVGNTIIAGPDALSNSAGSLASKVYRLNQASARSAAEYLASLGALIRIPRTFTTTESAGTATNVGGGSSSGGQTASNTFSSTSTGTAIEAYGGQSGPLQGLSGTIDRRLGTITLVGQPTLVSVAEQYLKQIDLRQRQVALSIRILDVTLDNATTIDNSFAFRYGNNFIVNQQGQLVANFGALKPPGSPSGGLPGLYDPATGSSPIVGAGQFRLPGFGEQNAFTDSLFPPTTATPFSSSNPNSPLRPGFGGYDNPGRPGVTTITPGTPPSTVTQVVDGVPTTTVTPGTPTTFEYELPGAFQYPRNQFFDFVKAQITSGSTKVLASPTLILTENSGEINPQDSGQSTGLNQDNFLGAISTNNLVPSIGRTKANESAVVVGERIITGFQVQAGQNGAPNSCQPEFGIAGLTFGARVSKIDDNGFVTFSLSPTISAASRQEFIAGCGNVSLLTLRSLDTGSARVRDGQTLILTGVLSDRDLQLATKWPILGDLPLVGQFFRNSGGNRSKRELVVMVTPRIINDTEGGTYGYGFEPSTRDTQQFMNASPSSSMPNYYPQR